MPNTADTPVPAWFLAPYEEKEIRKRTQERAESTCKPQFVKFGKCMEQHQILFGYHCKDLKEDMINCIAHWGSHAQFEKVRNEYIEEKKQQLRSEGKI